MLAASDSVLAPRYRPHVLRSVVEQHADDVAFLWTVRRSATAAPHTRLEDLVRLDERIEANLEGMSIAGDAGFRLSLRQAAGGEFGEVFTAAVLACESQRPDRLTSVIEKSPRGELARGLGGAFSWLDRSGVESALKWFDERDEPELRAAFLLGCIAHRRDPGARLEDALSRGDRDLQALALQAIGELGLSSREGLLGPALGGTDSGLRFVAARSAALLGDAEAAPVLRELVETETVYAEQAAELWVRMSTFAEATAAVGAWSSSSTLRRATLRAAAALGAIDTIERFVEWAHAPETSRLWGSLVTSITGIEISGDLALDPPEDRLAGPTDDPRDEQVAPDPDGELGWPDVPKVLELWRVAREHFNPVERHVLGARVEPSSLRSALKLGRQCDRRGAAFELRRSGRALVDVDAPAERQTQQIASLRAGGDAASRGGR